MGKDHLAKVPPPSWGSPLCQRLPFPGLRAAAGGSPASEVLLEMMQQRFIDAKQAGGSPLHPEERVSRVLLESGCCSSVRIRHS